MIADNFASDAHNRFKEKSDEDSLNRQAQNAAHILYPTRE
jgi:hypothetical protein